MKQIQTLIGLLLFALSCMAAPLAAEAVTTFETKAKQAVLIDFETGAVLYAKNADQPMAPSSMSKMMTIYMVFERLLDGRLSLDDLMPVSVKAWRKGGSKMFVREGTKVQVEDLLRGIIIQSGNDACIVIAEGIAGSEELFADDMTRRAREIGLKKSTFKNSTGWPNPEHVTTAYDLAQLAIRTIKDFPEYYHYYSEKTFSYSGIKQGNRNPLLYKMLGADGLKTGHTEAGGYGLTASAVRGGRRLILVINGLDSVQERTQESERLLEWGFREFANYTLFLEGETVVDAPIWLGDSQSVPLVIDHSLVLSLPKSARRNMKVQVMFDEPIPAPVQKGQEIAHMQISAPNREAIRIPLKAGADVGGLGPIGRLNSAFTYILWGGGL